MTHAFHQTKFRWTENLTSRFIQLRKENGNLFTGRKYSAQAGWEHILQQMKQEFPTIMADVHYRVLKKKWSNLLQQYKELKNPVHGDKNKSDDVSWPFYGAIDEVLGYGQRINEEDELNPHEFLCLSVTPEESASPDEEQRLDPDPDRETSTTTAIKRMRNFNDDFSIEIERLPRVPSISDNRARLSRPSQISQEKLQRRQDAGEILLSRLPPATELSIKTVNSSSLSNSLPLLRVRKFSNNKEEDDSPRQYLREALALNSSGTSSTREIRNGNDTVCHYNEVDDDMVEEAEEEEEGEELEAEEIEFGEEDEDDEEFDDDVVDDEERERPRKLLKRLHNPERFNHSHHECKLEKRFNEFLEYIKKRDEENKVIMTRILNAVEKIADGKNDVDNEKKKRKDFQ